jgi:hypothetical protein
VRDNDLVGESSGTAALNGVDFDGPTCPSLKPDKICFAGCNMGWGEFQVGAPWFVAPFRTIWDRQFMADRPFWAKSVMVQNNR